REDGIDGGFGHAVIVARPGRPGWRHGAPTYPRGVSNGAEHPRPPSQPIHRVAALRDVRIPVSDGLELSTNLWLPEPLADGAGPQTFPAVLEMLPYRQDDCHAASDESRGEWLAARGYAFCRLDVRGTGSSP